MKFHITTTYNQRALYRRLAQIFGTDNYVSEIGANIPLFVSIGYRNNLAVRAMPQAGCYEIWHRYDLPCNAPAVIKALI